MEHKKQNPTLDRTVFNLCAEIDELKEQVRYWQDLYESEKYNHNKLLNDTLMQSKSDLGTAMLIALSVKDDESGNLVIPRENRDFIAESFKPKANEKSAQH